MILFSQLPKVFSGQILQLTKDELVEHLVVDSRKLFSSSRSLFFAIRGTRNDGHEYIPIAYAEGLRQFVVEQPVELSKYPLANFILVGSSIKAIQQLATFHREQFTYPVIAITGSNGKTIIKEWIFQMLSSKFKCVKNPGSYNSQIGVPLSVWQMQAQHEFGIFEAGISQPGEMKFLQNIIQPNIGIFTTLGTAHDEGFSDTKEKLNEKLKLFESCKTIIYCSDQPQVQAALTRQVMPFQESIGWGQKPGSNVLLEFTNGNSIRLTGKFGHHQFNLPFTDSASRENILHCIVLLLHLGFGELEIQQKIDLLLAVRMRLELKQGINHCQIIDDSYNNDLGGLRIGIDFLNSLNIPKKTLILSDVLQSGLTLDELSLQVAQLIKERQIQKFVGIGFGFHSHQAPFNDLTINKRFYLTTDDFIHDINWNEFVDEAILIKGARVFQFEKIVQLLQKKIHGTTMEIDLGAMVHNLNYFRALLNPKVKLMVMVKAFAYGSGSNEIASLLQYHRVDYLGVAYADEGVELRNNNIHLPIMVMNPSADSWPVMLDRQLEPEIYSLNLLKSLALFLQGKPCAIHLKIDTGMHRLGFDFHDLAEAIEILVKHPNISIASLFSHLAAADDDGQDNFSNTQVEAFKKATALLESRLTISPLKHLLNTSGILRLPDCQFGMVRLGIGLYGIDPTNQNSNKLKLVSTLKTVVSQVKKVSSGDSIGYGRHGKAIENMTIATIAIGYADGFWRGFSNGVGNVLINKKMAPVIGNVCMDMTMIDVTEVPGVAEGDEVIIFGEGLPIEVLATKANTIPYEILTSTSERVKRIFYAESV